MIPLTMVLRIDYHSTGWAEARNIQKGSAASQVRADGRLVQGGDVGTELKLTSLA